MVKYGLWPIGQQRWSQVLALVVIEPLAGSKFVCNVRAFTRWCKDYMLGDRN